MKNYCNIEKLKLITLNQEQKEIWNKFPNFKIQKHLNDIGKIKINSSL